MHRCCGAASILFMLYATTFAGNKCIIMITHATNGKSIHLDSVLPVFFNAVSWSMKFPSAPFNVKVYLS